MKTQSFNDQNSSSLASKVRMLERELAEKTNLLERTSKSLADTQKQYQNLLMEFENFKSQVFSCNRFNASNSCSKSPASFCSNNEFSSFSSFEDNNSICNFKKSLKQLQNVEGNVQSISLQNQSLKSKIDRLALDQREWQNFASSVFSSIRDFVSSTKDFPDDDSEAQRFILLDLIQKLTRRCTSDFQDENLMRKYRISKLKLKQVQMKCDKILQLLDEKGYDITPFELAMPKHKTKNKFTKKQSINFNIISESDDNNYNYDFEPAEHRILNNEHFSDSEGIINADDLHDFKNDVKKLANVTHNMKGHYKSYAQLAKKRKL